MVIFEANKPMLTDPDKIYPGQKLRIPALNTIIEVSVHMVQSSIFFAVNLIYGKLMIWYKINFF